MALAVELPRHAVGGDAPVDKAADDLLGQRERHRTVS